VRSVTAQAETTFQLDQGAVPSSTTTYVLYPDKFRVDAMLGTDQVVQIYNAGRAWQKDPAGVREAPPAMRLEFEASVRRDTIPLLIGAAEGRYIAKMRRQEKARDGRMLRALEISGIDLRSVTLFIDEQNLIAGQSFSNPGPDGRPVVTEEVFSDYRTIDGVKVPFEAQLLQNGRAILKRTIKQVVFNGAVAESLFARPQ
jgi:hypothetical protein